MPSDLLLCERVLSLEVGAMPDAYVPARRDLTDQAVFDLVKYSSVCLTCGVVRGVSHQVWWDGQPPSSMVGREWDARPEISTSEPLPRPRSWWEG